MQSIRGFNASASLKRRRAQPVSQVSDVHPRLQRLGLIEAFMSSSVIGCHIGPHPRLQRLGLIEAVAPMIRAGIELLGIRGFNASASLKQCYAYRLR